MSENHEKIVFFDTEISTEGNKIYDIGAVSEYVEFHSPSLDNFLKIVKGAEYICGHNIIEYDLKILNSKILNSKKKIDTLFFSPLLFPTHPYHSLVKDDKLQIEDLNNPLNDSKTARKLFFEEVDAFSKLNTNLKNIYCNLLYQFDEFKDFFIFYGIKPRTGFFSSYPDVKDTELLIFKEFEGRICENADIKSIIRKYPIELAYALSLIRTTDYHSITPPWVLKKYPRVENIITLLCHTKCSKWCKYCSSKLDIRKRLKDFFGFESFKLYNGENLQEKAVQAAVDGKSLLAVFPTGGGKSLTFQLPALIAGEERRGLTVVISPLQSLMKDQVDKLNDMGLVDAVSINGLLSPIERSEAIDRVRSGLATILYIAPESLRSNTIEKLIFDRSVVRFVVDEAHCFSAWGQDFRVDYLYIAEFIRKYQKAKNIKVNIPVSCFTATAKQKVISDICDYFRKNLGLNLERFSTSFQRINLHYNVLYKESDEEKYIATRTLLTQKNCPTIIYVSRTKRTFEIAQKLTQDGYLALPYNGKMSSDEKISNQDKFINGQVNIIVATSAFGMGVDKKDVKLVIHYDISDSLENYVQEAGRAGRDENIEAECYVLFNENDLDKHFVLLNQTKLSMAEIAQVWKAIKSLTNEKHRTIFSSPLEIARQAGWDGVDNELETRVKTAIAALENAGYIKRKKNCPKIFATSILVKNMAEAVAKIDKISNLDDKEKESAKRIIKHLISSKYKMRSADCEAESRVDYLSDILGISKELCIKIINLLRLDGILDDYKDMTGYIQVSATNRNIGLQTLNQYIKLEEFILKNMRENESVYSLKELNENAKKVDIGHSSVKKIDILLNYLSIKGYVYKKESGDRNYVQLVPKENLSRLFEKYNIRVDVCRFIIEYLYSHQEQSNIVANTTKSEALVQFSLNELYNGYLSSSRIFPFKQKVSLSDIEDCLLYLTKIKTLKIERGFFVLYSALEIQRIIMDNRIRYKNEDYKLLDEHYKQKIQQIHIVGEYANLLVKDYNSALVFVSDYFQMDFKAFIQKYFYGEREKEINRNITVSKYRRLFETLSPIQKEIIDDKNSKYIVICAGPGSGKTRVLVHKLSSLLMLEDVKHEQLLMLAFSRAAVSEFKKRIFELMGNAINYIDIKTFHSYCFDLLGRVGDLEKSENIVQEALKMIDQGLSDIDERILTKTVLVVDEAQDMDENEFMLVRKLMSFNDQLRVILVGDDDQNIYEFRQSNSEYMNSLVTDFGAKQYEMLENYRSAPNLIKFTNKFLQNIKSRNKKGSIVPVKTNKGICRIVKHNSQNFEEAVVNDLIENHHIYDTCVLTNTNYEALKIVGLLRLKGLSACLVQQQNGFNLLDIQEIRFFIKKIKQLSNESSIISEETWQRAKEDLHSRFPRSKCMSNINVMLKDFESSCGNSKYFSDFKDFVCESKWEDFYDDNKKNIWVSTIHKSKGREFKNVYLFLNNVDYKTDQDFRKIYVGMTRAKENLVIHTNSHFFDKYDSLEELQFGADNRIYSEPQELCIDLCHRDVHLGSFFGKERYIFELMSGDELFLEDKTILATIKGKKYVVGQLSKSFYDNLCRIRQKGYDFDRGEVNFIVAWRDKEEPDSKEIPIILPMLYLRKKNI